MHNYKTILAGVIFALIAGLAQAANVVYVTSFDNDSVLKFDADTGAFLGVFVPAGSGGLNGPTGLTFGPDGHLYVASFVFTNTVLKYHGQSGRFLGVFVSEGSGGLQGPMDLSFGADGNLYVVSSYAGGVFRYDGRTGAFIDQFTSEPSGAEGLRWRGRFMYASSHNDDTVFQFDGHTGALLGPLRTAFSIGPQDSISGPTVTCTSRAFLTTAS